MELREIKFRAWSYCWDGQRFTWQMIWPDDLIVYEHDLLKDKLKCTDSFIIMQYAELKDKNGKELYIGDIINRWNDIIHIDDIWQVGYMVSECTLMEGDFEIIGNIHQNPELI